MDKRWEEHIANSSYGSTTHFHNAIRKYPEDSWEHDVLFVSFTLEYLTEAEHLLIAEYDTFESGYNSNIGYNKPLYYKTKATRTPEQIQRTLSKIQKTQSSRTPLEQALIINKQKTTWSNKSPEELAIPDQKRTDKWEAKTPEEQSDINYRKTLKFRRCRCKRVLVRGVIYDSVTEAEHGSGVSIYKLSKYDMIEYL